MCICTTKFSKRTEVEEELNLKTSFVCNWPSNALKGTNQGHNEPFKILNRCTITLPSDHHLGKKENN